MRKTILPIVLAVALLGSGIALAVTLDRAHQAERALEELYQSALNETAEEMQALSLSLEKVLISVDPAQGSRLLSQISRTSGDVRRNLTFLPLSHDAMAPTLSFANQLSDYTAELLPMLVSRGTLTEQDQAQLAEEWSTCAQLSGQLMLARQTIAQQQLSLRTEADVFSADAASSARPLEALGDADNGMSYPTLIYDGAFSDAKHLGQARGLPEGEITAEEALTIARAFVGESRVTGVGSAPSTTGVLPAFGVTVRTADVQLNLDITVQGGKVLWMMPEMASFPVVHGIDACRDAAAAFLDKQDFGEMEATHHQVYDGLCVINFASVQEGVLLYPDLVKVQVRMDTAEVVGLEANNYWMNHTPRTLSVPTLTLAEAEALLSPAVTVQAHRLCVIPWRDSERLCYEFSVTRGDGQYLIYLDASTGSEVELLKMIPIENGTLTA